VHDAETSATQFFEQHEIAPGRNGSPRGVGVRALRRARRLGLMMVRGGWRFKRRRQRASEQRVEIGRLPEDLQERLDLGPKRLVVRTAFRNAAGALLAGPAYGQPDDRSGALPLVGLMRRMPSWPVPIYTSKPANSNGETRPAS
jgi:hypothetical protein